jgi:hypothetical protein
MKKAMKKAWTDDQLEQWAKTRAQGKQRFVWTHGVLQWGGFMFSFSFAVFQHRHFGDVFSTEGNLPFRLILALSVWIYVGYLYGRSRWLRNEQAYLAQKSGE